VKRKRKKRRKRRRKKRKRRNQKRKRGNVKSRKRSHHSSHKHLEPRRGGVPRKRRQKEQTLPLPGDILYQQTFQQE
jgi:hypothetical protein